MAKRVEVKAQIPAAFQFLFEPHRYKVAKGGRGSTKSWSFARACLIRGSQNKLRHLCTREVQSSIRESVHHLLADQIQQLHLGAFYDVQDRQILGRNGTDFIFAGLSDQTAESIKSFEGIDICWVEEATAVSEFSWKILIPTIRKPGSEIWVSYNPDLEHDPVHQRFVVNPPPSAVVRTVSWRDNPWFSQEMRDEMEHLRRTDEAEYRHVWEGELQTLSERAVYAKQILKAREEGRITAVPIANSVLVNTFWDLGKRDSTAIWFHQEVGPQNRFIDYYENRGQELEHYIRVLKDRNYLYGRHYLPHDAEAEILGMPLTRRQQLEKAGIKPTEVLPRVGVIYEGIEATRRIFSSCWFDEIRCREGVTALSNYAWDWDEEKQVFSREPVHNWASHGADAFRQFAQGYSPSVEEKLPPINYPKSGVV